MVQRRHFAFYKKGEFIGQGTIKDLSALTGLKETTLTQYRYQGDYDHLLLYIATEYQLYNLYQHGEHVMTSPLKDIQEHLNMNYKTLLGYINHFHGKSKARIYVEPIQGEYILIRDEDSEDLEESSSLLQPNKKEPNYRIVTAEKKSWRPSKHTKKLHDMYFAKWNLREEAV